MQPATPPRLGALRALLALPLLALAACSGGTDDPETALREGYSALAKGDGSKALPLLERAAAGLATDPSAPRWKEIQLALVEARGHVDAARAKQEFLATVRANPTRFAADDFATVGNRLAQAGAPGEAIDVVDAGLREFGHAGHRGLEGVIRDIQRRATESGDTATTDKLRGLGYVGGVEEEDDEPSGTTVDE